MSKVSAPGLILIDVQVGIDEVDHWGGNRNNPEAEQNIERLLSHWRRNKLPVVVVQHSSKSALSPFRPGQRGNDLKDFVEMRADDKHVKKSTTSAFTGTDLEKYLTDQGIGVLVICGFVTNNSVEATVRHAGDLGFDTTVASDAVACFNKRGIDGSMYDSGLVQQISLSNLAGEYASIKTTDEIIRALGGSN
ncbi:MAG TPA: cysteine hydrolase family protein [Chryseolinea sp.]|nr:cysteine hydrolase family protein [Chryseolinea sp.]